MMDKIEKISEKLIKIGYRNQNYSKLKTFEEFEGMGDGNKAETISELTKDLGGNNKANELYDSYLKTIYNDYMPEMLFDNDNFELEFYLSKNLIKITAMGKSNKVGDDLDFIEVFSFKEFNVDDFHCLFIEKDYDISFILNGGGDN